MLQSFSFKWNLMSTKSIHYSHQLISTGTATAVWRPSENFQILSIWKCFFPILLCKIRLQNAHCLLVGTKVDPKVVSYWTATVFSFHNVANTKQLAGNCYSRWRWWSDIWWATLIRLQLHPLSYYLWKMLVDFPWQSHICVTSVSGISGIATSI
jgi:hypothetical protein